MDSYNTPLWDLSQATSFAQLPDDDFLAILQKQFPNTNLGGGFTGSFEANSSSINPQNLGSFPPGITPPSEDSSPSPPGIAGKNGEEDSPTATESALKRKASMDDDDEEGPSQKTQHTAANSKKGASTMKRKSSGAGGPDESRLMKRKEQNRAAQRAFRERKEKHVKDLEDKVAALEAKNEQAASENENLRDLLTRLQAENMNLKQQQQQQQQQSQLQQSAFTFSVPKDAGSHTNPSFSMGPFTSDASMFSSLPRTTYTAPSLSSPQSTNPLDWSSLTSFDPSMLNLLDEPSPPQQTATGDAMQMDLGYSSGDSSGHFNNNFKIIASNPTFLSLASAFDSSPSPASTSSQSPPGPSNEPSPYNFDMSSLTPWNPQTEPSSSGSTLDDLFGNFMANGDFGSFMPTPTISPIVHHDNLDSNVMASLASSSRSPAASSSSSPGSQGSDPSLFSIAPESTSSESDVDSGSQVRKEDKHANGECPKTRSEFIEHMNSDGQSAFAPSCPVPATGLASSLSRRQSLENRTIACQGTSSFPPTKKDDRNVEVLSAWRQITSDPHFKDVDINQLCSDFSNKARCDGSKVVLEPHGMSSILQSMHAAHASSST